MRRNNKALYEQIMKSVSREVKRALNEWNIHDIKDEYDNEDNFTNNPDITQVYDCPKGWKVEDKCFILEGVNRYKDNRTVANRYIDNWDELPIEWTSQYSLLQEDPWEPPFVTILVNLRNRNRYGSEAGVYVSDEYARPLVRFAKLNAFKGSIFPLNDEDFKNLISRSYVSDLRDNYVKNYNNLPENIKILAKKYGAVDETSKLFLSMYKISKENIVFLYIIHPSTWDGKFIITHINNI